MPAAAPGPQEVEAFVPLPQESSGLDPPAHAPTPLASSPRGTMVGGSYLGFVLFSLSDMARPQLPGAAAPHHAVLSWPTGWSRNIATCTTNVTPGTGSEVNIEARTGAKSRKKWSPEAGGPGRARTDSPLNRRSTKAGAAGKGLGSLQPSRSVWDGVRRSSGPSSRGVDAGDGAVTSLAADTTPFVG